jgi:hypothetical protein
MSSDPNWPVDEAVVRNRFIILNLVRIGGSVLAVAGIVVWQADWLRDGGVPVIGIPMALIGLYVSFGLSQQLARKWRTPPTP